MTLKYKFLEDIATADVAFEAEGDTLEEMLEASALATVNVMVRNMGKIKNKEARTITVEAEDEEKLLYNFLDDIIFYKDSDQLLFGTFEITVSRKGKKLLLSCKAMGEKLDMKRHDLVVDVKAVTYHEFSVFQEEGKWKAHVILDI